MTNRKKDKQEGKRRDEKKKVGLKWEGDKQKEGQTGG
jgi:hypothetical protein